MLRKILTACLFLILFPLGAFAISYDELKNNPTKYILVYQSPRATAWVDVDSIRVTRYKLPELNIDTDFYTVVKDTHIIVKDNRSFSYDLDQAAAIRLKEIEKKASRLHGSGKVQCADFRSNQPIGNFDECPFLGGLQFHRRTLSGNHRCP